MPTQFAIEIRHWIDNNAASSMLVEGFTSLAMAREGIIFLSDMMATDGYVAGQVRREAISSLSIGEYMNWSANFRLPETGKQVTKSITMRILMAVDNVAQISSGSNSLN